jgi:hypothetical protein
MSQDKEDKVVVSEPGDVVSHVDKQYAKELDIVVVPDSVRVEQGEYAVIKRDTEVQSIGTHHVRPCVVICAKSASFFGMAHFDTYRFTHSLDNFFQAFQDEQLEELIIDGGMATATDNIRYGGENKQAVLDYIKSIPIKNTNLQIKNADAQVGSLNCVYDEKAGYATKCCAAGLDLATKQGAMMRIYHNLGAMIAGMQSTEVNFFPLLLSRAVDSKEDQPFLVDRLGLYALQTFKPQGQTTVKTDPGDAPMAQEVNFAFTYLHRQVKQQQEAIANLLITSISDSDLADRLARLCPVFLGDQVTELNAETARIVGILYKQNQGATEAALIKKMALYFNEHSPYPLMHDLMPAIEQRFPNEAGLVLKQLQIQYGADWEGLLLGVDVPSADLAHWLIDGTKGQIDFDPTYFEILLNQRPPNAGQILTVEILVLALCNLGNMPFEATLECIQLECNKNIMLAEENSFADGHKKGCFSRACTALGITALIARSAARDSYGASMALLREKMQVDAQMEANIIRD